MRTPRFTAEVQPIPGGFTLTHTGLVRDAETGRTVWSNNYSSEAFARKCAQAEADRRESAV